MRKAALCLGLVVGGQSHYGSLIASMTRMEQGLISSEVDAFIRETMKLWDVQGLQVAVVRRRPGSSDEWDVDTRAYGVKDRSGKPMETDTLFPIASNSKAFTAAAVGLLVANDSIALEWSTKIKSVLPEFKLRDPVATKYTNVVDILGHRTGMPRHDFVMPPIKDAALNLIKYMRPSAEFRDVWQYNNHMYDMATTLLERVTGVPFFDFVRNNIFEAAELVDSGRVTEGFIKDGVTVNSTGTTYATYPFDRDELRGPGSGCILASMDDMALWLQIMLDDGKSPKTGNQVVPAAVLGKMSSGITAPAPGERRPPELAPRTYGIALSRSSYQGRQYIDHGGALMGYHSQIIRFPNDGLGIAVFANEDMTFSQDAIRWRIAEDLLELPLRVDWNARYTAAYKAALQQAAEEEAGRIRSPPWPKRPSVSLEQLANVYRHPAYGRFALAVHGDGSLHSESEQEEMSLQFKLQHFDGNLFNLTVVLFHAPLGHEKPLAMELSRDYLAEFEVSEGGVVQGFGIWGQVWGAGMGAPPLPSPEVWPWDAETANQKVMSGA
ncbi:beta-lactamase/transpeptidase-like protein [Auriculariales sp. MPI-PUGE-AT-0066]|nr:beta-lactamase/transpeptidase-like protein [Auriculariales sp. MPI-PUGE-AT-0066]